MLVINDKKAELKYIDSYNKYNTKLIIFTIIFLIVILIITIVYSIKIHPGILSLLIFIPIGFYYIYKKKIEINNLKKDKDVKSVELSNLQNIIIKKK